MSLHNCYAKIRHSNWLKLFLWIATSNQSALFLAAYRMLLYYSKICLRHRLSEKNLNLPVTLIRFLSSWKKIERRRFGSNLHLISFPCPTFISQTFLCRKLLFFIVMEQTLSAVYLKVFLEKISTNWMAVEVRNFSFCCGQMCGCGSVWPDWAIYWTLGNFSKPLATINLPKSPTF